MLLKGFKYKAFALILLAGVKTWAGHHKASLVVKQEGFAASPFKIVSKKRSERKNERFTFESSLWMYTYTFGCVLIIDFRRGFDWFKTSYF